MWFSLNRYFVSSEAGHLRTFVLADDNLVPRSHSVLHGRGRSGYKIKLMIQGVLEDFLDVPLGSFATPY